MKIYILVRYGGAYEDAYNFNIKASFDREKVKRWADEENDRIYDIRSALAKDRYYEFPDEALEKKLAKLSKGKYTNIFEFDDIGGFEVKECEFEK